MSNIPEARRVLKDALDRFASQEQLREAMWQALDLMTRKSPTFVARRAIPPLTEEDKQYARILRNNGYALNDIAHQLGTNIGRVSEAVNT